MDYQNRERDIEMMENPERWPKWPLLPLKRWRDGNLETAFIIATAKGGDPVKFLEGNIAGNIMFFALMSPEEQKAAVLTALDRVPRDLANNGWVVD